MTFIGVQDRWPTSICAPVSASASFGKTGSILAIYLCKWHCCCAVIVCNVYGTMAVAHCRACPSRGGGCLVRAGLRHDCCGDFFMHSLFIEVIELLLPHCAPTADNHCVICAMSTALESCSAFLHHKSRCSCRAWGDGKKLASEAIAACNQ